MRARRCWRCGSELQAKCHILGKETFEKNLCRSIAGSNEFHVYFGLRNIEKFGAIRRTFARDIVRHIFVTNRQIQKFSVCAKLSDLRSGVILPYCDGVFKLGEFGSFASKPPRLRQNPPDCKTRESYGNHAKKLSIGERRRDGAGSEKSNSEIGFKFSAKIDIRKKKPSVFRRRRVLALKREARNCFFNISVFQFLSVEKNWWSFLPRRKGVLSIVSKQTKSIYGPTLASLVQYLIIPYFFFFR